MIPARMAENKSRYWGILTPLPAPVLTMQAKMLEQAGVEGLLDFRNPGAVKGVKRTGVDAAPVMYWHQSLSDSEGRE